MTHIGAQQGDERLIAGGAQTEGIERNHAPFLSRFVERIGWCADPRAAGEQVLAGPMVGACGIHANGQIVVEPDGHCALARPLGGRRQLFLALPLQIFEERHALGVAAPQLRDKSRLRIAARRRPA